MPLTIPCEDLQPGTRLSESLMMSGRMLLPGDKALNDADVSILKKKYPDLIIRIGDPILDEVVEFEEDGHDRDVAQTVQQKIAGAMTEVRDRFANRSSAQDINFQAVQSAVSEVMGYLRDHPVSAALLSRCLSTDSYLADHTGNVFYLSMMLGSTIREYVITERERLTSARELQRKITMNLTPLGLAVMLMDLGMFSLQHLFDSDQPLTDEDRELIRQHPIASAEMLPEEFSAAAKTVIRTHHENYDGSGYPDGIRGKKLHIFARIVRLADAYDAATATHVYKQAKSPARAVWEIAVGPYARFFDPVVSKVFCRLIQPFPIGAKLRLCDGRYAVVVKYNRRNPFQPTVIVAFDKEGQPIPKNILQPPFCLEDQLEVRLASFGKEDLSFIYEEEIVPAATPSSEEFNSLYEAAYP